MIVDLGSHPRESHSLYQLRYMRLQCKQRSVCTFRYIPAKCSIHIGKHHCHHRLPDERLKQIIKIICYLGMIKFTVIANKNENCEVISPAIVVVVVVVVVEVVVVVVDVVVVVVVGVVVVAAS